VPTDRRGRRGSVARVADGSERRTELRAELRTEPRDELPQFSETAPIAIGTAVWALLLVVGLVIRSDLENGGRGWWIWSALAGFILGCFGYLLVRRRQRRPAPRPASARPDPGASQATPDQSPVTADESSVMPDESPVMPEQSVPGQRPADQLPDPRTPDRS
jgi:hypothetical protein